jgi:tetratricopeptide (TPR) repeat protein
MSRRRCVGAAWLIACAIVATTHTADARPKRRDAKAAFDRGLAAYKKANFAAASEALSKSYELERDPDTLFAWAQAERKLEHCDRALDLYDTVLTFELPAKNREAVERSIADCRAAISAQQPAEAPAVAPAPLAPQVPPTPAATPTPTPTVAAVVAPPMPPPVRARAWYRDPVALELLGVGVVATGIGAGLLISAHGLDDDAHHATTIDDARRLGDQARSRGNIGLITASAGGALAIAGVVWIVAHRHAGEPRKVAGWLAPGGGGLAVTGAF